jgi:hypothetical protein
MPVACRCEPTGTHFSADRGELVSLSQIHGLVLKVMMLRVMLCGG